MIPIGPIIWLVARGLQQKNRGGGAPAKPIEVKPFVVVWVLAVLVELGVDALYGTTGTIVFFCLASPFLFPWSVTRLVFIPRGWGHPALHLSKLAGLVENAKSAGPAFAAAAALSRSHRHDERLAERIVKMATRTDADVGKLGLRHYPAQPASMNAAAVAALGFVAASRGDRDRARLLLRTALDFPRSRTPAAITRLCLDWLAAEAYDRRDYGAVIDLESANPTRLRRAGHRFLALGAKLLRKKLPPPAVQTEAGCGSQVRFLAAAARRRAEGAEQISNAELILRWARTGRPHLFPLLRAALRALQPRKESPVAEGAIADPLASAIELHAEMACEPPSLRSAESLGRLARAWDRALEDDGVFQRIAERELALGLREGIDTLATLASMAADDVAALARESRVSLREEDSELLAEAAWRAQSEALGGLQALAEGLRRRVAERKALAFDEEMEDWVSLKRRYEAAAERGPHARRVAFTAAVSAVWDQAAWLFNARGERQLAHAQFRWLQREAELVGNEPAATALRRNAAIGV